MNKTNHTIYDVILQEVRNRTDGELCSIKQFQLGMVWSYCKVTLGSRNNVGFAMTPQNYQRTLNWPGTIRGQNVCDITSLIESWNPFDTVLAMSAANAVINSCDNTLLECAETIPSSSNANLSVFYHFKPYLKNRGFG